MFPKNYLRKTAFTLLAAGSIWALNACGGEKKTDDAATAEDTTAMMEDTTSSMATTSSSSQILSALPKTSEVPAMIHLTGAEYDQTLINAPAKAANYTTTNDKAALNLGVYATDIGYLSVYNKTQDVLTYLKGSQKLADHLGLSNAFGSAMQKRFQENLSSQDSLVRIVDETMSYVQTYLAENQRDATGAMVVAGSFIEGLHISTGLIEKYPKNIPADIRNGVLTQLILKIIDQKKSLADLIGLMKSVKQDDQVTAYTQKLTDLQTQFEALKFEEKVKANVGDFAVTDKTLLGITAKVKEIRSEMVK